MKYSILLCIALCGCASQAKLIRALSKDPAIVSSRVVTPWGTAYLTRVGSATNSTVSIGADGTVVIKGN